MMKPRLLLAIALKARRLSMPGDFDPLVMLARRSQ